MALQAGITDSKGKMHQAPLAAYLPQHKLPAGKWVRVTVPWKAFAGLQPAVARMHSVWLKVRPPPLLLLTAVRYPAYEALVHNMQNLHSKSVRHCREPTF